MKKLRDKIRRIINDYQYEACILHYTIQKLKGKHLRNVHNCKCIGAKFGVLILKKNTD
jgi:hypothetical protein